MVDADNDRRIHLILDLCEQIERCNGEIYMYFAKLFSDYPEMTRLWHKTALEEENHALQFSLAKKLRNLKVVEDAPLDVTMTEKCLSYVKDVLDVCVSSSPSQIQALETAMKLEERLAEFHANSVAVFVDDSFRKLFTAMMKADRDHFEAIRKVYYKLQSISAQ